MTELPEFHVRLYGRPGCCLCDDVVPLLEQLRAEFDYVLEQINIDSDIVLKDKLCCQIPVVTINGGNRVALRITLPRLRRAFERASKRSVQPPATGSGG